jgi:hypothetical protein
MLSMIFIYFSYYHLQFIILSICLQKVSTRNRKLGSLSSDSENDSDKTKDTVFQVSTDPFFKFVQDCFTHLRAFLLKAPGVLVNICNGTSSSDKVLAFVTIDTQINWCYYQNIEEFSNYLCY